MYIVHIFSICYTIIIVQVRSLRRKPQKIFKELDSRYQLFSGLAPKIPNQKNQTWKNPPEMLFSSFLSWFFIVKLITLIWPQLFQCTFIIWIMCLIMFFFLKNPGFFPTLTILPLGFVWYWFDKQRFSCHRNSRRQARLCRRACRVSCLQIWTPAGGYWTSLWVPWF